MRGGEEWLGVDEICGFSTKPTILPRRMLGRTTTRVLSCGKAKVSIVRVDRHSGTFRRVVARTRRSLESLVGVPSGCGMLFLRNKTSRRFTVVPVGLVGGGITSCVIAKR